MRARLYVHALVPLCESEMLEDHLSAKIEPLESFPLYGTPQPIPLIFLFSGITCRHI